MTGSTPGPWEWDWGHSDNLYQAGYLAHVRERRAAYARGENPTHEFYDYPQPIVQTDNRVYGPNDADARLIAAAPDMLAALKRIYQQHYRYLIDAPDRDMLRAAIAKADGPAAKVEESTA